MSDNTNIFSCMKESLQKRFLKIKKRPQVNYCQTKNQFNFNFKKWNLSFAKKYKGCLQEIYKK